MLSACRGCGDHYAYPRTVAGKEPAANAAEVRINQSALDFVSDHLPSAMQAICCTGSADSCAGKAPCFIDGGKLHFYIGAPSGPVGFDITQNIHADIRAGEPFPATALDDDTDDAKARPMCNDTGGVT